MQPENNSAELVCVDDTHYLHISVNPDTGKPCNSSVGPAAWQDIHGEDSEGWRCIGCGKWWRKMPEMEELGLFALSKLK